MAGADRRPQGRASGPFVRVENPDGEDSQATSTQFLDDYELGSNGTVFSPQGGLRASAHDFATIALMLINRGELEGYEGGLVGHPGNAYGLYSGFYCDPE